MASSSPSLKEAAQALNQWLAEEGKNSVDTLQLLKNYIPRIRNYIKGVDRVMIGSHIVHPQAAAWSWKFEDGHYSQLTIDKESFLELYQTLDPDEPFLRMERNPQLQWLRHSVGDAYIPSGGMTELLQEKGYTDLYGIPSWYRGRFQTGITWATKQTGGFTSAEIQFLEDTKCMLRMTLHILVKELVTQTLLCTYLGSDPGLRVHNGSVDRGDGVTVRSVIWFSDVRGFTSLSSRLDRDAIIELINDVFEVTEAALKKCGGEILKFMGDGVLAVIKEEDEKKNATSSKVCQMATRAAQDFQLQLKTKSEERIQRGLPGMEVGIGLHYGNCSYGNVGSPSRLDFTVIGNSVNLASRVEGLCAKLKASVLATEDFVQRNEDDKALWKNRGNHTLKGVTGQVPVYELTGTVSCGETAKETAKPGQRRASLCL